MLHQRDVDIVFVQESHSTENKMKRFRNDWGGRVFFDHGTSEARGAMMLFERSFDFKLLSVEKSVYGRYIIVKIEVKGQTLLLINVYAPNQDEPKFFEEIFRKLQNYQADKIIMGGDFNVCLNNELDRKSARRIELKRNSNSANLINTFMEDQNWCDIWRVVNGDRREFTWRRRNPFVMSRLDFFLIPYENVNSVVESQIVSGVQSDHSFISLTISLSDNIRGRGYWKLNTSVLHDIDYLKQMNKKIDISANRFKDPCFRWEVLKLETEEFSQYYCKRAASTQKVNIYKHLKEKLEP